MAAETTSEELVAVGNWVLLEIILHSDMRAADVKSKIPGFVMAKPEFEALPMFGKVYKVGDGVKNPEFKIGDIVIFKEDKPHAFTHNGIDYLPVRPDQIKAIYTGDISNLTGAKNG